MVWQQGHQLKNGDYTIESILGSGGFGDTYKAIKHSPDGEEIVAIKALNSEFLNKNDLSKHEERFVQEAFNLLRCSHPHVVRVFNVFKAEDLWCMEMEFIRGKDLHYQVIDHGIFSEESALEYIQQLGDALNYVHQQGFLHRDVKPKNVLICNRNNKAILIDFGLAREFVQDLAKIHTTSTSQGYSPIEQYEQNAKRGAYTDVYAIAATLYYMLTGKIPLPALYREQGAPLKEPIFHNPDISNWVNNAIMTGMELFPEDRPQTMKEWLALLGLKIIDSQNNSRISLQIEKEKYYMIQKNI